MRPFVFTLLIPVFLIVFALHMVDKEMKKRENPVIFMTDPVIFRTNQIIFRADAVIFRTTLDQNFDKNYRNGQKQT